MGFVSKNGQRFDDWSDYLESIGYRELPSAVGGGYVDPSGNRISNSQANQVLIAAAKKGEVYPDKDHIAELRNYGYTGLEASEAAAENFAQKEMAGFPETNLTSPESILSKYKDVVDQYGIPNFNQATESANRLNSIATSSGFSPYATAQLEQQKLEEAGLRDALQAQLGGARSTALSNLASSGGYDSGARERVLRGTGLQSLIGGQQIGRQGFESRAGIGASDALYKQNLLSSMPSIYSNLASTGTAMWNPYLNQATTEQGYGFEAKKYNIDRDVEKFKLSKQLSSQARQSYAESPNPYSYTTDIYR